eukprot:1151401-Pelagomonas_calceolata.AAC.7
MGRNVCQLAAMTSSALEKSKPKSQPDDTTQSQLSRTLKVLWDASIRNYQPEELRRIFAVHGLVEDVVVRSSKKKRQPTCFDNMFTTSSLNSGSDPWKAWGIPLTYSMLATFCMSMRGIFCNLAIVTQHRVSHLSRKLDCKDIPCQPTRLIDLCAWSLRPYGDCLLQMSKTEWSHILTLQIMPVIKVLEGLAKGIGCFLSAEVNLIQILASEVNLIATYFKMFRLCTNCITFSTYRHTVTLICKFHDASPLDRRRENRDGAILGDY